MAISFSFPSSPTLENQISQASPSDRKIFEIWAKVMLCKHLRLSKFIAQKLVTGLLTDNSITTCQELLTASRVPLSWWNHPPTTNSIAALQMLQRLAREELANTQRVADYFAQRGGSGPSDNPLFEREGAAHPRPWSSAWRSGPAADWHSVELARQADLLPPDAPVSWEEASSLRGLLAQGRSNAPGSLTTPTSSAGSSSDQPRPSQAAPASPVSSAGTPVPDLVGGSDSDGLPSSGDSDSD